jgi:hypothetical protein
VSILSDLNPQAILAKIAIVGLAVGGAYLYGHHNGYSSEKAAYDLYVSQQAQKAEAQAASNKAALAFQQTQFELAQAKIQKEHTDALAQVETARVSAVADSAHYADRLRYYLAHPSVRTVVVSGSSASATGTPADSEGASGQPDGVSDLNRYLTQRFYTADKVAATLNEAIDLIAQDRLTCNGKLPGVTQ